MTRDGRTSLRHMAILLGISLTPAGCSTTATSANENAPTAVEPRERAPMGSGTFATNSVAADAARNHNRHPDALLEFLAIVPGSKVVDVGAGDAFTSMHMAERTGPEGVVYAHNTPAWRGFLKPYVEDRLRNGPLAGIEWVEAPFADPVPEHIRDVDLVTNVLTYHDTVYYPVDRDAMNRNIFAALRPGGRYVIVDHAARPEDAEKVAHSLHRISEEFVIEEVTKAGFLVDSSADFLRYEDDDRTGLAWTSPQPRTDRFVIAFRKPATPADQK